MGYLNLVNGFVYKDPVFRAKLDALCENDAYLKDNGWNDATKTLFYQAAVPVGWTKDTTNNDKFLRVVNSSGAGSGGSTAPSATIALAHSAHSITAAPDHTHDLSSHTHILDNAASNGNGSGTVGLSSKSGYLYNRVINSPSGTLFEVQMRNLLNAPIGLTSGSAGTHSHGGNSSGSALADITFAYCDVIVGGKDTGGGTYVDLTTYFHSGDKIDFDPFVTLATNDAYLYARLMPAGSIMIFGQATAPTGWTKIATTDDKALRVVSGTGAGSGGSYSPSTQVTMAHTHTTPTDTGHAHTLANHSHAMNTISGVKYNADGSGVDAYVQADGGSVLRNCLASGGTASHTCYQDSTNSDGSGNTATSASHTHTLATSGTNFTLAYVDVIQASKDSTGSPQVYQDVTTGVFGWKKLVSYQKLNKLAMNDEYLLYHSPPSGLMKAFFFMATVPITWTKIVTQHDKALRIVSGSTGGTPAGGAQLLSVPISLAHTHSINAVSHTHSIGTHTHTLASGAQTVNAIGTNGYGLTGSNNILSLQSNSGSTTTLKNVSQAGVGTSDSISHDHGGVSGSALTDVTLAYVDVLYASKD